MSARFCAASACRHASSAVRIAVAIGHGELVHFAANGIDRIEPVMTDHHWSYKRSAAVAAVIAELGAIHKYIKLHCPWQNGKVERFNRVLQTEWAYRQIYTSNDERAAALAPWLETSNPQRRHSALEGKPPVS